MERELERLERRRAQLTDELTKVTEREGALRQELSVLTRLVDGCESEEPSSHEPRTPELHVVPGSGAASDDSVVLRGASIREAAVRLLATSPKGGDAVHYRTWYELLARSGIRPAGRDPLATFLTQLGRSPVVRRTTKAGVYELDLDFPVRARARLSELRAALAKTNELPPDAGVAQIANARERRAQLQKEAENVERALEEALRSLGDDGNDL
jgi:hypothetical protein